ncbi:MAG: CDP-alcohol phosphatidyltransferase family protein [Candidatus Aminicenantes bacterium]|nr:CDP-alcohol phosphatidyltransferase family protein [Candidatus Aminicenantes bacterium]
MEKKEKKPPEFSFRKSLKEETKYPILSYLRVERYFTRPLASLIVRAVFNTRVTPNHLTYVSFYMAVIAGVFYCFGEPLFFIFGGIFTQLSSVFDCADGQLARSKDMCTRFGAYLDLILDRLSDFLIFTSIAVGYYIYSGNLIFFLAALFANALYFLQLNLYYISLAYLEDKKTGQSAAARGLAIFIIFVFSLLNLLDIIILLVLAQVIINVVYRAIHFPGLNRGD